MHKNFDQYYKEYLAKYNQEVSPKTVDKKEKINLNQYFLFSIFITSIIGIALLINYNLHNDFNSKQINNLYSEKYINEEIHFKNIDSIDLDLDNLKEKVALEKNKVIINNNQIDRITSDSIIKMSQNTINKSINNDNINLNSLDWKKNFSEKKIQFIETLLPLIAFQNQKILVERKRLIMLRDYINEQKTLKKNDIIYLNNLAKQYSKNINEKHKIDLINELLISVDVIPNSIVLAQAANESGWGTSRFAKEYNALFGQYTYDEKNGVVPIEREIGKKHLIRYFSSVDKSVESYFININTHHAYKKFRKIRSQMTSNKINIKLLTQALDVYAEDESYVKTINAIIDSNNFIQFDFENYSFTRS